MAQTIVCNGVLDTTVMPPTCSVPFIGVDTGLGFDVSQLDPNAVMLAFSAGATIVFPAYGIAWGAAFVINTLRGSR